MSLSQLIYVSDATELLLASDRPFSYELDLIHEKSRINNRAVGVTGILLFSAGHFLQVLEGHHLVLNRLFQKISNDPRHTAVQKLAFYSIENRLFDDWNMGLLNLDATSFLDRSIFDDVVKTLRHIDPSYEAASQRSVKSLLVRFKQHLQDHHNRSADLSTTAI